MDHSGTLGCAPDADLGAFKRNRRRRCLHTGVGGHDGAGEDFGVCGRRADGSLQGGHGGDYFLRGKRDADDSGGRWEDFVEDAAEGLGGGGAGGNAAVDAGLAGGAVGVAGVDEDGAYAASGGEEMAAAYGDRGGDYAVGGVGCGGYGYIRGDCGG